MQNTKSISRKSFMHNKKNLVLLLALLAPGVIMLAMFTLYPIIKMFIMSFFDWKIGFSQTSQFIGLENYITVLKDPIALRAFGNTLFYLVVTVPAQMVIGLFVALLIYHITKFSVGYRLLYYLPVITSWVVVALLFRYIFSNNGLLNYYITDVLKLTSKPIGWLSTRWTALSATALLGIWKGVGWNMVIFLAALQTVPKTYYEAASIDGANAWQKFFRITIPKIKGTILFALVMLIIGAFNTYTPIAVMTEGNPAHQTEVILTWVYSQTFDSLKMGYSAALSFIVTVIILLIAIILFKLLKSESSEVIR